MKSTTKLIYFFSLLVIGAIVCSSYALAIEFPLPVNGRLSANENNAGQTIKITNERTGISITTITNDQGEYLYDWANSDNKAGSITRYSRGDKFKIEVVGCSGVCDKTIEYSGQPEIFIDWDMSGSTLPKIETGCECDNSIPGILGLIVAFIMSIGGGMQIYKNRSGGITILHRHRGILGYHNPDTQHRNLKYRHAKLSTAPVKYAKDIKKIEEKGGLI